MSFKLNSGIRLEGLEDIEDRLIEFLDDTESAGEDILQEAAEILEQDAKKRAAVSEQGQRYGQHKHPPGTMRDAIEVGYVSRGKRCISVKVGIAKNSYFTGDDKFYPRMVEFGTSKMVAQPYMRPALVRKRSKVRRHVMTRLQEEVMHD